MPVQSLVNMLPISKRNRAITSRVTAILLTASITINVYLLLFTHQRKVQIKNIVSLDEKNIAFLDDKKQISSVHIRNPVNQEMPQESFEVKKEVKVEEKAEAEKQDSAKEAPGPKIDSKILVNAKDKDNVNKKEQTSDQLSFCADKSIWTNHLIQPKTPTDYKDWTFKKKRKCPNFSVDKFPVIRPKVSLDCQRKRIVTTNTTSSRDVLSVEFGNNCLADVIDNCCLGNQKVPNVVHYIWYSDRDLGYFQFVSFMSALRFIKPCLILIHGMYLPRGKHWNYFVSISPNIIHVVREKPTGVFGHKLAFEEHASDIMRIEALKHYGGIYLDFDEIVLRPLEPLRKYEYTQGHERDVTMGSQLVMSKKNATFLNLWYQSYKDDYHKDWAWNALWVPNNLSKQYPELIHVEGYNFTRPNWQHVDQIFKTNYDWSTNYGMHLYIRWYKNETNNVVIRKLNTTIGAVCRHVMFGNKELCVN